MTSLFLKVVVVRKIKPLEKKISHDYKTWENVSYERKKIISYQKNFKLTQNNIFENAFCDISFLDYRFLQNFSKLLHFHELWLIFSGKISSSIL